MVLYPANGPPLQELCHPKVIHANQRILSLYRTAQSEPEVFASPRQPAPTAPAPLTNRVSGEPSFVGMTGGQIFHEMMLQHDVKHIFGYPGGAILPVYDAIYNSKQFQLVLPRHEQGAGHMAEGYARAT